MIKKVFQRKILAHNLHKAWGRFARLYSILVQTENGAETQLNWEESEEDETEMELMFLPLNLDQCLQNWEDGAKKLLYWADFAQKYGETVATVATLGWILVSNDYEVAIRLSAIGLMRGYGLGEITYNVPAMVLFSIAEKPDKTWGLIWGLADGPEVRVEVEVDFSIARVCLVR